MELILLFHPSLGNKHHTLTATGDFFLHRLIQDRRFSTPELRKIFLKQRFDFTVEALTRAGDRKANGFQAALARRGTDRALFLLETVPGFADFSFGQMHPLAFS